MIDTRHLLNNVSRPIVLWSLNEQGGQCQTEDIGTIIAESAGACITLGGLPSGDHTMPYSDHEHASTILELAKEEIADGQGVRGAKLLRVLIQVFPESDAAQEAQQILDEL